MPGEVVLSGEDDREHQWIQHAWCGADKLDIEEPVIAHNVWCHAQDGSVMRGVEHGAHNIALRWQGNSMSGSIRVADAQRPGLKAQVAYGFVCIANQRIGDTTCQEVRKQSKAHIDAIILLID